MRYGTTLGCHQFWTNGIYSFTLASNIYVYTYISQVMILATLEFGPMPLITQMSPGLPMSGLVLGVDRSQGVVTLFYFTLGVPEFTMEHIVTQILL